MKKLLVIPLALIMLHCAGTFNEAGDEDHAIRYRASYQFSLDKVDRPDSVLTLLGDAKLDTIRNDTNFHSSFEDRAVRVFWGLGSRYMIFSLLNKTKSTMKILWNEAAYVDQRRAIHPLGHGRDYYVESSPSIILSNTFTEDGAYPSDYRLNPIGEAFGGPLKEPLFLDFELHGPVYHGKYHTIDEFKTAVSSNLWTTVQLLLPLEIEGQIYNYFFTFRITNITVERTIHDIPKFGY